MEEFLHTLLFSLNAIEVKGKNNMDILLGCMEAIEQKLNEVKEADNGGRQQDK